MATDFFTKKVEGARNKAGKAKKTIFKMVGGTMRAMLKLVSLAKEAGDIKAEMDPLKTQVRDEALRMWTQQFAERGVQPERPMGLQIGDTDELLTLQVQDRSGQYNIAKDQEQEIIELIGPEKASQIIHEELRVSFDRELLANPKVAELVRRAMNALAGILVRDEVLTEPEVEKLLEVKVVRTFRPGTMDRLPDLVRENGVCDEDRLYDLVKAMRSHLTSFVET